MRVFEGKENTEWLDFESQRMDVTVSVSVRTYRVLAKFIRWADDFPDPGERSVPLRYDMVASLILTKVLHEAYSGDPDLQMLSDLGYYIGR